MFHFRSGCLPSLIFSRFLLYFGFSFCTMYYIVACHCWALIIVEPLILPLKSLMLPWMSENSTNQTEACHLACKACNYLGWDLTWTLYRGLVSKFLKVPSMLCNQYSCPCHSVFPIQMSNLDYNWHLLNNWPFTLTQPDPRAEIKVMLVLALCLAKYHASWNREYWQYPQPWQPNPHTPLGHHKWKKEENFVLTLYKKWICVNIPL